MSKQYRCIICGEYLEGTEEHIIPKSLGNQSLKTWSVCKQCNSGLGTYVDNYLVNHRLIQIIRQNLGLKGQSGQIPNPFKEGKDKNGQIIRVNDNFELTTVPKIEEENGKVRISAPTKEEAKKIALKKLKRSGLPDAEIQKVLEKIGEQESVIWQPEIEYDATVDFNLFYLAALKIAYEYAYCKLGDKYCWKDATAERIREVLYKSSRGDHSTKYDKIMLIPSEMAACIRPATHLNCHLLFIHPDVQNQLIVEIILFMSPAFSYSVCVSEKAFDYCEELKYNDMEIVEIQN